MNCPHCQRAHDIPQWIRETKKMAFVCFCGNASVVDGEALRFMTEHEKEELAPAISRFRQMQKAEWN